MEIMDIMEYEIIVQKKTSPNCYEVLEKLFTTSNEFFKELMRLVNKRYRESTFTSTQFKNRYRAIFEVKKGDYYDN